MNLEKIDFINLLQIDSNNNGIIYSLGNNILKVFFNALDYDSEDSEKFEEKNKITDNDELNDLVNIFKNNIDDIFIKYKNNSNEYFYYINI